MSNEKLHVRQAAVLGAGVMGAQIAAHLANAGVQPILFELAAKEGDPNANAQKAIDGLKKLDPGPLSTAARADFIRAANYGEHLDLLKECDVVIEAIAERIDWKQALYEKVAPHLSEHAILATNTSGLSINELARAVPETVRPRFCGVHFFNPPRYMHLVELVPCYATEPAILDRLETFLVSDLGKGVIRAKDTPNFIANRVGVFSMLATMHHCREFGLGFDVVDALTGPAIGRPKSATFRTADVVGLDTLDHVIHTMAQMLAGDPWHRYYASPDWLKGLIETGALGQKTRRGIYRKEGADIQVLDPQKRDYRPLVGEIDEPVREILKIKNFADRFAALRGGAHPQARFLWVCYRDVFHYCAAHLEEIADNARDVDLAMRWGFGWNQGPFELWQAAGWQTVAGWIAEEIAAGKTMANTSLPGWVTEPERTGVHGPQGSYSPAMKGNAARSALPVYKRQAFPDALPGEPRSYGQAVFETDAVHMWHMGDDIAVLSFKSKMHTIGDDVLEGTQRAIEEAERGFKALVIWQTEPPFSAGANLQQASERMKSGDKPSAFGAMLKKFKREAQSVVLKAARQLNMANALMAGRLAQVEQMIVSFQQTTQTLKYAMVPTVAAVDGLALGGGCEFIMNSARAVATLESYIGLVEAGVGLLPAGGGCKEFVLRASRETRGGNHLSLIQNVFQTIAMAQLAKSAEHARELGYLRPCDRIVMNRFELLHAAKAEANALAEAGYHPPLRAANIAVAGRTGIGYLQMLLANMKEGGYISQHDHFIASRIARVLCGGDVEQGSLVDEDWLLDLEREAFMELIATEKTQARIEHTLKTGKPLRN